MNDYRKRIKDLREDHDYTKTQIAQKIGITQRKYSYIETGTQQLTADILIMLSDVYNVSTDYILCQTDFASKYPDAPDTHKIK